MDFPAHQVHHRRVNETMALNRGFAGKGGGNDVDSEMAALARSGMTGMSGAVVHDSQALRFERGAQSLLDQGHPIAHAGNTWRNGYTSTAANTPAIT